MSLLDDIRQYWDDDAATYDRTPQHRPTSPAVMAAWTATLERLLPPVPAKVLDCGAGTGFLSLIAARLGHRVTALDLSPGMLEQLTRSAAAEHLAVEVVHGPADEPPADDFDAVMERHLLWTLPDPAAALAAWRRAAPEGRLVIVSSLFGTVDPVEAVRGRLRHRLRRLRGTPPEHHAEYPAEVRRHLPLGTGTDPARLVELAGSAGWTNPRLERLRDVEWAERRELPLAERLLGVTPRLAVSAR
ncbi:MAG TPA: class I SAM-dependent methyltransferase [Acidimicrobiales bacterium]|nr:class I SAM-dependent methyltransferase [Acidimicrobiales bacterium]